MAGRFAGKVALVTGGSRSIGAAIVKRLAGDGAAVALTYSASPGPAEDVVRGVVTAGGRARAFRADAGDVDAVRAAVADTAYPGVRRPGAPLLISVGDKHDWTPADACRRLVDAARQAGPALDR